MKIVGLCGSLRKNSFNRKILEFAMQHAPEGVETSIVEIGDLPFFNQDLEGNPPQNVVEFKNKVKEADALLFSTPEFNHSISSVLKNAIEWGSRPYHQGVMANKRVAIMGVSNGMIGTARAQLHFREVCVQVRMHPLTEPEVLVTFGNEKFDEQGNIIDEHTKEKIIELVKALAEAAKQSPNS